MLQLTIIGKPITKKNSQRILRNRRTGKPFVAPSAQYEAYRKAFILQAGKYTPKEPIAVPVAVCAIYYMPDKRRVDITNLMNATHDLLQDSAIIADDSSKIVKSVDGSRVLLDRENPRVEILIKEYEE